VTAVGLGKQAELARDQALLIAAAKQAERRGDTDAVAGYDDRLKELANQLRTNERATTDAAGRPYFAT
jgi:hypothetical protein